MKKNWLIILTIIVLSLWESKVEAKNINFSAEIVTPENQINRNLSYFNLLMTTGQEQQLGINVTNISNQPIVVLINPNRAITSGNGAIDYTKNHAPKNSTLTDDIESLISKPQTVQLASHETKTVIFDLTMPNHEVIGSLLGAFHLSEVKKDEQSEESNVQIKNDFAYVIGVHLRMTMEDIEPQFDINEVRGTLQNSRTAITGTIQNSTAVIMKKMTVTAKVTKKGQKDVLYSTTKENVAMAPNSTFVSAINLQGESLEAGTYLYQLTIDGTDSWELAKEFIISSEKAKEVNQQAVELDEQTNWYFYLILALGVIIILLIIILLKRKKK